MERNQIAEPVVPLPSLHVPNANIKFQFMLFILYIGNGLKLVQRPTFSFRNNEAKTTFETNCTDPSAASSDWAAYPATQRVSNSRLRIQKNQSDRYSKVH